MVGEEISSIKAHIIQGFNSCKTLSKGFFDIIHYVIQMIAMRLIGFQDS